MKEWTGENWHDEDDKHQFIGCVFEVREANGEWLTAILCEDYCWTDDGEVYFFMFDRKGEMFYPSHFDNIRLKYDGNPTNGTHQPT